MSNKKVTTRYTILPTASGGYWYVRNNAKYKSTGIVGTWRECHEWILRRLQETPQ